MSIDLAAILSGELLPSAIASPAPAEMLVVRIAADGVITLACLMMAAALITFVVRHRRPLPFAWAAVLCAAVTTLGAVSHALDIVAIWQPIPVLQGVERALSAAVLLTIALAVVSQLPKLLLMQLLLPPRRPLKRLLLPPLRHRPPPHRHLLPLLRLRPLPCPTRATCPG